MLRISRLADYGVVVGTHLAGLPGGTLRSVRELSDATGLPQPTISKVLKLLSQDRVVESTRGVNGGYRLAEPAADITVARVIAALEGPIGITECGVEEDHEDCDHSEHCSVRGNWQLINRAILGALDGISLAEMASPRAPSLVSLTRKAR
ncbi:MAG: SUF system Fe-S cluster assembly regulator [Sandaracinaceae bacterium]